MSNKVGVLKGLEATFGVILKDQEGTIKVNVPEISNDQFGELHTLVKNNGCRVNLKRSGAGITVLVFV